MMNAIFLTRSIPSSIGTGDRHRAYQIQYELRHLLGRKNVETISLPYWQKARENYWANRQRSFGQFAGIPYVRWFKALLDLTAKCIYLKKKYLENPYKLFTRTPFTIAGHLPHQSQFVAYYKSKISQIKSPAVCIIDDVGFAPLLAINSSRSIRNISCIHNLESLDTNVYKYQNVLGTKCMATDFQHEINALRQYTDRLFISKVETALVNGLGLTSHYYPYLPVGKIRQRLLSIRQERIRCDQERGTFLMLATMSHDTTRICVLSFLNYLKVHGLPADVRLIVGGKDEHRELKHYQDSISGLEVRGWLNQKELDHLLVRVQAILVPQYTGFGGVTRLAEMFCAGVPILASAHASFAVDAMSGMIVLDNNWDLWLKKLAEITKFDHKCLESSYLEWEHKQPKTLDTLIRQIQNEQ